MCHAYDNIEWPTGYKKKKSTGHICMNVPMKRLGYIVIVI